MKDGLYMKYEGIYSKHTGICTDYAIFSVKSHNEPGKDIRYYYAFHIVWYNENPNQEANVHCFLSGSHKEMRDVWLDPVIKKP